MVLQIIFGMTSTPSLKCYLSFGRRILIKVLSKEPSAAIRIPDVDTIMKYQQVIQNRHPNLPRGLVHYGWIEVVPPTSW
jgi:hypothetical protein